MANSWKPGYHKVPGNLKPEGFHKRVNAVLNAGALTLTQYSGNSTEVPVKLQTIQPGWAKESGDSTLLSIRFNTGGGVIVNLSYFTEQELDAIEDFFKASIERARSVVRERDATAREAVANGDYSFARSNRPDPKLIGDPRQVE